MCDKSPLPGSLMGSCRVGDTSPLPGPLMSGCRVGDTSPLPGPLIGVVSLYVTPLGLNPLFGLRFTSGF